MFRIWCEVWGGVTSRRASWLKSNGVVAEYITREEAEAEAARLNRKMAATRIPGDRPPVQRFANRPLMWNCCRHWRVARATGRPSGLFERGIGTKLSTRNLTAPGCCAPRNLALVGLQLVEPGERFLCVKCLFSRRFLVGSATIVLFEPDSKSARTCEG
jgi:hypothetical protein